MHIISLNVNVTASDFDQLDSLLSSLSKICQSIILKNIPKDLHQEWHVWSIEEITNGQIRFGP